MSATQPRESRWERIFANIRTIGGAVLLAISIRIMLFEAFEIEGPSMEPTLLDGDRVVVAKFMYGLFLPFMDDAVLNWGTPNPGDIVILRSPERGQEGVDIVKRVIGTPGDTIEVKTMLFDCGNGSLSTYDRVFRNGEELATETIGACAQSQKPGMFPSDEGACTCQTIRETLDGRPHLTSNSFKHRRYGGVEPSDEPIRVLGPHTVEADNVFVLGDHRDASNDSRSEALGSIPLRRIKGRALWTYWSNGYDGVRWQRLGNVIR
ncbi:MAG: signal peptidase I [Myxococcota bacterium]